MYLFISINWSYLFALVIQFLSIYLSLYLSNEYIQCIKKSEYTPHISADI